MVNLSEYTSSNHFRSAYGHSKFMRFDLKETNSKKEKTVVNNSPEYRFLQVVKASLYGKHIKWDKRDLPSGRLFYLSRVHKILPLVMESYSGYGDRGVEEDLFDLSTEAVRQVEAQIRRTDDFLRLISFLKERGLDPVVVKGFAVRRIYSWPYHRISADEDIYIEKDQFALYHKAFTDWGLELVFPGQDMEKQYELAYRDPECGMYIEAHKTLFPPDSEAYGDWNTFFKKALKRTIHLEVFRPSDRDQSNPTTVRFMAHTDHFFYLFCHAYKHFLHGGFGIRQICDMNLYGEAYFQEIDWDYVWKKAEQIHGEGLLRAVLAVGDRFLLEEGSKLGSRSSEWQFDHMDIGPLLEDVLEGGLYGASTYSRLHSSTITLKAVSDQKKGIEASSLAGKTLHSIILPLPSMEGRYPYLKKNPGFCPLRGPKGF